MTGISSCLLGH